MSCDHCGVSLDCAQARTFIGMDGESESLCSCGSKLCQRQLVLRLEVENAPPHKPDAPSKCGW